MKAREYINKVSNFIYTNGLSEMEMDYDPDIQINSGTRNGIERKITYDVHNDAMVKGEQQVIDLNEKTKKK